MRLAPRKRVLSASVVSDGEQATVLTLTNLDNVACTKSDLHVNDFFALRNLQYNTNTVFSILRCLNV